MNLFSFKDYDVLIDYAHNPAGLMAIQEYLKNSSYQHKIGIVCGIGDRRDEDSIELGRLAAEMFDKVIIKEDADLRGRSAGEATEIVKKGIASSSKQPPVIAIANEKQALQFAMKNALPGSLIMHCVENIDEVIAMMQHQLKEQPHGRTKHLKLPLQKMRKETEMSVGMNL